MMMTTMKKRKKIKLKKKLTRKELPRMQPKKTIRKNKIITKTPITQWRGILLHN